MCCEVISPIYFITLDKKEDNAHPEQFPRYC